MQLSLINSQVNIRNFFVLQISFFLFNFVVTVFVSFSIISSHVITELSIILAKCLPFLQLHVAGFQYNVFHIRDVFYTRISIYHYSAFDLNTIFFPSNLHLHLLDMSYVKVFDSFFPVIILKICTLNLSVLFGTHTLLEKSIRVLKLLTHLSDLTANGSS